MNSEKVMELEYEAVQQEKRDKLNSRGQVWSLLVGLVGAFGLASVQSGGVVYVVVLYPLLAWCVARYALHSERVLDQLKAYLLQVEVQAGYSGYEHFNTSYGRRGGGGHLKALRDAILLTDMLAGTVVVWRLLVESEYVLAVLVVAGVLIVLLGTWHFLHNGSLEREKNI